MMLILSDFIKEYPHHKSNIKEILPEKTYDFNIEHGLHSISMSLGLRVMNDPEFEEKKPCFVEFKQDLSNSSSINYVNLSKNSDGGSVLITVTSK